MTEKIHKEGFSEPPVIKFLHEEIFYPSQFSQGFQEREEHRISSAPVVYTSVSRFILDKEGNPPRACFSNQHEYKRKR